MQLKTCPKCDQTKPLTEFYVSRKEKDGRQYYCKSCSKSASVEWSEDNPQTKKKNHAHWYYRNQDKKKSDSLNYYYNRKNKG